MSDIFVAGPNERGIDVSEMVFLAKKLAERGIKTGRRNPGAVPEY